MLDELQKKADLSLADWSYLRAHEYKGEEAASNFMGYTSISERIVKLSASQPEAVYITAVSLSNNITRLTYGDLNTITAGMAYWLQQYHNIRTNDVVAFMPANNIESVCVIFAILRAGATVYFVNPNEPKRRIDELLQALDVKLILASGVISAKHGKAIVLPDLSSFVELAPDFEGQELEVKSRAMCFPTSGSTASSKIVAQSHYNIMANAQALQQHHDIQSDFTLLGCLPIYHVNGVHFTLCATLWSGSHAVLLESFNSTLFADCVNTYTPHVASVVPSILENILYTCPDFRFPAEFRYFVSAAAPLSKQTCVSVLESFGVKVMQGYGLTETTNFSAIMPREISDALYRQVMLQGDTPSIGIPIYGNEIAILNKDGQLLGPGEVGEICMRGHNVMLGYLNNKQANMESFRDGWFHSGDLGYKYIDESSGYTFIYITGRLKNIAKVFGVAVSLEEMERCLLQAECVDDAACFSEPDQVYGEVVLALIKSRQPLDQQVLSDYLRQYFNPAVLPRKYCRVDEVPRTATGKIIRRELSRVLADID